MKTFITLLLLLASTALYSQSYSLYVCDEGDPGVQAGQILKFDDNGQNGVVFINSNLDWPQDIVFLEFENVALVSNRGNGKISKHDATTGAFISYFANAISGPTRMKVGIDGLLYVLQYDGTGKVRRYFTSGSFFDEFTDVGVPNSLGMTWDIDGNLYVSSYSGGYVRKFGLNGEDLGMFISSNLQGPTNIWFDSNGDMLVADHDGNAVKRFDASGNYLGNFLTGLSNCEGVTIFPNGNILVGNAGTHSIKMFDSNGNFLQDLVTTGTLNLLNPNAVALRPVTNVSVPEVNSNLPAPLYPTIGNEFFIAQEYQGKIKTISVYNAIGKNVMSNDIRTSQANVLDVNGLADGIYIVRVGLLDGRLVTQRLVLQNKF